MRLLPLAVYSRSSPDAHQQLPFILSAVSHCFVIIVFLVWFAPWRQVTALWLAPKYLRFLSCVDYFPSSVIPMQVVKTRSWHCLSLAGRETATAALSQAPVCSEFHHPAPITFTKLLCFTYEADRWRLWMIARSSQTYAVSNFLPSFYSLVCWADFLTDCLIDGYSKGTFMSPINNPLKVFLFFFPPKVPLSQFSKPVVLGTGFRSLAVGAASALDRPAAPLGLCSTWVFGLAGHCFVFCFQQPNLAFFSSVLLGI